MSVLESTVAIPAQYTPPRARRATLAQNALFPAPPAPAVALLDQARQGLAEAERADTPAQRYCAAHLSALRAAAAVLAVRAKPEKRRSRPTSAWVLLAAAAPELGEWAAFFAAGSKIRSAAEAGITRLVSTRSADDLLRQSGQFLELVERVVYQGPR